MTHRIIKTSVFQAPAEKIFRTLMSRDKLIDIYPSLEEIEKAELLPNGGYKTWWLYKIAGRKIRGISEDIEVVPNKLIKTRISGGIECALEWSFEKKERETWVTIHMDYMLPFHLIGHIGERVARSLGEQEAENTMMNLTFLVEDLDSLGR